MSAILIKNGMVYDGTGAPPKRTDILIERDHIARLGDFGRRVAERIVDATGAAVIPGQLVSKKLFKRKVFLSTPIHHHFEALGWPESQVTMRFWIVSAVMTILGLVLFFLARFA